MKCWISNLKKNNYDYKNNDICGIGRGNKAGNGANNDSCYVYILKKG